MADKTVRDKIRELEAKAAMLAKKAVKPRKRAKSLPRT